MTTANQLPENMLILPNIGMVQTEHDSNELCLKLETNTNGCSQFEHFCMHSALKSCKYKEVKQILGKHLIKKAQIKVRTLTFVRPFRQNSSSLYEPLCVLLRVRTNCMCVLTQVRTYRTCVLLRVCTYRTISITAHPYYLIIC